MANEVQITVFAGTARVFGGLPTRTNCGQGCLEEPVKLADVFD
jgi:hypothetical protein